MKILTPTTEISATTAGASGIAIHVGSSSISTTTCCARNALPSTDERAQEKRSNLVGGRRRTRERWPFVVVEPGSRGVDRTLGLKDPDQLCRATHPASRPRTGATARRLRSRASRPSISLTAGGRFTPDRGDHGHLQPGHLGGDHEAQDTQDHRKTPSAA